MSDRPEGQVSLLFAARGRCPYCGKGKLYKAYLKPASECSACGQRLATSEIGDGPVVFVILIAGFVACAGLLVSFLTWNWPAPVLLSVWPATAVLLCLILMPVLKALMIASHLKNKV